MGTLEHSENKSSLKGLIKLMRPKQWVKNAFVFAPLVFSGLFSDSAAITQAIFAFVLFCIASSATYILNDYRDIEADRLHPIKSKKRPLASGEASPTHALILMILLWVVLIGAAFVQTEVMIVIFGYLALNVAYSLYLKHQPVLDIFTIAAGFVLRVYAGAVAIGVPVSMWMFVTTLCLALYLAAIKRKQELAQQGDQSRSVLKKYTVALVEKYAEMSATGALLFYSLFVINDRPELAVTVPIVLFGLFRYWYIVEALEGGESPTDALISDWPLLFTALGWVATSIVILLPV